MNTPRFLRIVSALGFPALALCIQLQAQEVRLVKLEWKTPAEVDVTEPKITTLKRQPASAPLSQHKEIIYIEVAAAPQKSPGTTSLRFDAAHPSSSALVLDASALARTKGIPFPIGETTKRTRVYAIYNPGKTPDCPPARLRELVLPATTERPRQKQVMVSFTLDRKGAILDVTADDGAGPELTELALAAAKKWRFSEPWRTDEKGQAVVRIPVAFIPRKTDKPADSTPSDNSKPVLVKQPDMPRGSDLTNEALGKSYFEFTVSETGRVASVTLLSSTNPAWAELMVPQYLGREYKPATKDGHPVATTRREGLASIGGSVQLGTRAAVVTPSSAEITELPDSGTSQPKTATSKPYDVPPAIRNLPGGAYPYDLAVKGLEMKAAFLLAIDTHGRVAQPAAIETDHEEFQFAIRAMIDAWRFEPAKLHNNPVATVFKSDLAFGLRKGDVHLSESARKILKLLKSSPDQIVSVESVERPAEQIAFLKPVMPSEAWRKSESGTAEIEFFVDPEGHAQLPRILSASEPAFGYAAAQAVAFWRFVPLKKDGAPAIVRMKTTVNFPADCREPMSEVSASGRP